MFWNQWLFIAAVLLAIQGLSWIAIGSFDTFGLYDRLAAAALLGADTIPDAARPLYRFVVGLLGATDAAFFVLFAFVVKYPFARRERWAHTALTAALLTWFVLDSAVSIAVGAWFNVIYVNLPCLVFVGIPLAATAREFHAGARRP